MASYEDDLFAQMQQPVEKKPVGGTVFETVQLQEEKVVEPAKPVERSMVKTQKPRAKKPAVKKNTAKDSQERPYSYIRDFPRAMAMAIKSEFLDAVNMTDALVAYLYCYGSADLQAKSADSLTPEQKALIASWRKSNNRKASELRAEKAMQNIEMNLDMIEMLLCYSVFDRIGFRQENPSSPQNVNFLEDGVEQMMERAASQTMVHRSRKALKEGRPKS